MPPKSKPTNVGLKPGGKPKDSGIFTVIDPKGKPTKKQVTISEYEKAPPTPKKGETYKITTKTKHDSKKK